MRSAILVAIAIAIGTAHAATTCGYLPCSGRKSRCIWSCSDPIAGTHDTEPRGSCHVKKGGGWECRD
ncbi:unnamed protein product [Zymoseptoria tritici ST99CH_1E4]|uniref:CBM1 domain-containing protein n=1 Tax=Zymoseptoria tritici ST99CH_1E4 TaxID=1276532 RepID=A0A2H1FY85_ZYMTR|nr:unnamed protein product [Zymoseptoria tritici ST99CH_1E4]